MTRQDRWVTACIVAGLALRLAFSLGYWVHRPLTHDEREYLALARSVARGDGMTYPADEPGPGTAQRFGRAPGYPFFLSLLRLTSPVDEVPARVKIVQCLVGALGVWFIALIAGRAAGPKAGAAAAAIAAAYPPLVWMPAYALSETLYSTLALAAALLMQERAGDSHTPARTAAVPVFGVLTALAVLVRPAMLFFVPLAIVWLAWRARRIAPAVVFVVVLVACVAPWTIRNHRVYGRWIAVASEGGVTFWTGNHPLARGEGDLAANPELKRSELSFRAAHPGLTPEQLEPLYYRDAFAWMRAHPAAWLSLEARKAFFTIVPAGPSYALHSAKYLVASVAAYLLILPAAAAGAWRARGASVRPTALWLMAAATVLAGLVFFPQERFRLPVVDPALIVSAALLAGGPGADERSRRRTNV